VPPSAQARIDVLDFKNTEIKDVVRSLAAKYGLNVFVDDAVTRRITLRLTDIPVHDALAFIAEQNSLELTLDNSIYKLSIPEIPKPKREPVRVQYQNGLLSIDVKEEEIDRTVRAVAEASRKNIVLNRGADGYISGLLQDAPFDQGFATLMKSNGFIVRRNRDIYTIDREGLELAASGKKPGRSFFLDVKDSLLTIEADGVELDRLVREAAGQLNVNMILLSNLAGTVSLRCNGIKFEDLLNHLFKATDYTYRNESGVYLIGGRNVKGIYSTKLVPLKFIKAEGILEKLPDDIKNSGKFNVINEHNAIMAVANQNVIREFENYVAQIDYPVPQILIEALVVDYSVSDESNIGITAGLKSPGDSTTQVDSGLLFPGADVTISSENLNKSLQFYAPKFGVKNIGKLPDNFYMTVHALEKKGKANVRSQPQIATLNGNTAKLSIGTTQYYQLESYAPIVGGNYVYRETTQRFEKIEAEISLEITPWVSASGEITTIIKPNFSTPREQFDPKVPPAIDYRRLESTVRLRDGETIVLGGLISTTETQNVQKLPVLGSIPVLGYLFQNRTKSQRKDQLMIYITPHLMYANEGAVSQPIIGP
jgi:type IV pilus assembly protein PilQ